MLLLFLYIVSYFSLGLHFGLLVCRRWARALSVSSCVLSVGFFCFIPPVGSFGYGMCMKKREACGLDQNWVLRT